MLKLLKLVAMIIGIGVTIAFVYALASEYFGGQRAADLPANPHVVHFVGTCAGYDMSNPELQPYAVAECLGRLRGFIDGNAFTADIATQA